MLRPARLLFAACPLLFSFAIRSASDGTAASPYQTQTITDLNIERHSANTSGTSLAHTLFTIIVSVRTLKTRPSLRRSLVGCVRKLPSGRRRRMGTGGSARLRDAVCGDIGCGSGDFNASLSCARTFAKYSQTRDLYHISPSLRSQCWIPARWATRTVLLAWVQHLGF